MFDGGDAEKSNFPSFYNIREPSARKNGWISKTVIILVMNFQKK